MDKNIRMKFHEVIHPLLLKLFSSKTPYEMVVEGKIPDDGTYLIVANHLCIKDIPQLAQSVKEQFFLLVSDEDKYTIDGLGLTLNGVKWVCRTDKESRRNSSNEMLKILNLGKNFAMYPEATWNLSPNLLMLPMNYGCIRTANEANVKIIPIVSFFSDGVGYTKIGEPFAPTENLEESIDKLRDIMATMYFEEIIKDYERKYMLGGNVCREVTEDGFSYYEKREDIDSDYWINHVDELYNQYGRAKKNKSLVREYESQFIFTPKSDSYDYFQEFNSSIRYTENGIRIKRISSENNGYGGSTFDDYDYKEYFGFGYNEHVLKRQLKK